VARVLTLLFDPQAPRPSPDREVVPEVTVDPQGLPGGAAFQEVVGGLLWYGLLFMIATIAISAIVIGIGRYLSNSYASSAGRLGFFGGLMGAMLIGGARFLVQYAYDIGAAFE
jgi:hypothetical protein